MFFKMFSNVLSYIFTALEESFQSSYVFHFFFRTRENETSLLKKAKEFTVTLEKQRSELEKGDNFPAGSNANEVTKLREQYLKFRNETEKAEDRKYQVEYRLEM